MAATHDDQRGFPSSGDPSVSFFQRLSDALLIIAAHFAMILGYRETWEEHNTRAIVVAVLAYYLVAESQGLYRSWRGVSLRAESFKVLSVWTLTAPILLFLAFATKTSADYSRVVVVGWFVLTPPLLLAWRYALRLILAELRRRGKNIRTVGIAGATQMAEQLAQRIKDDASLGMRLVGFYDDRLAPRLHRISEEYGAVVGNIDQLVEDARAGRIDLVYIALPLKAEVRINSIVRRMADTTATVCVVADFMVFDLSHPQWGSVGGIPVVSIFDSPFSGASGWLKRIEDIVIGTILLALVTPPMLVVSVLVKLSSPGPVFFVQRRYGLNGRPIRVLKFRSMTVTEDNENVKQAVKNDPRLITLGNFPLGAFLRKNSLDELPQFLNVLKGDMSIVGPRPHAIAHNEFYRGKIHGYMLRHKVKPGITGWAQVNGWRGETDTEEKMLKRIEHDLEYIRNWTLPWDIQIIFLTVFGRKKNLNAY
jgi:putative colanic acid biosynthesis UDP-glucose lipid carrier transferase